jgi:hypothetical protein
VKPTVTRKKPSTPQGSNFLPPANREFHPPQFVSGGFVAGQTGECPNALIPSFASIQHLTCPQAAESTLKRVPDHFHV